MSDLAYQNPLIERYASDEMSRIFSAATKFSTWRRLWLALAESQQELGLPIPDEALRDLAGRYDRIDLQSIEVPRSEWERALRELEPNVRAALSEAADAIRAFHASQLPVSSEVEIRRICGGHRTARRADASCTEDVGCRSPNPT